MRRRFLSLLLIMCIMLNLFFIVPIAAIDLDDQSNMLIAMPSTTSFVMDNKPMSIKQAYIVNGNNYLQLRAIAELLNGTKSQFNVSWDGKYAVIETGKPYSGTANPASLNITSDVKKSSTAFKLDGKIITFDNIYLIDGGTNYLQLREFASKLKGTASQFNVYWDTKASQAVIVPGAEYTGEEPKHTEPASHVTFTDGWYNLRNVKNGKYVIITSKGSVALENVDPIPEYYVKHVEGNNYTIQTDDGKYFGMTVKATNGTQVKAVINQYLWTLRLESGKDTFSLRLAENTKMLFNGAGQSTIEGDMVNLWTYEGEDVPNYGEFKFIPVSKSKPAPAPAATPTPTPTRAPVPTATPTPIPVIAPNILYTDINATSFSVENIYGCAFSDNKELTKLTIPSSVWGIGKDILSGSNPNVVIYGEKGSRAELYASENGYKFAGTEPAGDLGLTTIKLGQTEAQAGISHLLISSFKDSNGVLRVYGNYKSFFAVFYVNNKANFIYTNDLSTYLGGGRVYTDSNDNNRQYAASMGTLPALDTETTETLIFFLTNAFRAQHGLPDLLWNERLEKAARSHSEDMANRNFFSHTNPDGLEPWDRIAATGYHMSACAENIAMMSMGVDAVLVMDGWINSSSHRTNLLNKDCDEFGIGVFGAYATQNFGRE